LRDRDYWVTAVIPAYNEEERIGTVLEAVTTTSLIDEVIVVDDGSEDGTLAAAAAYRVRTIKRASNGGKGAALQTGIEASDADILVFLDADLIGLTPKHIAQLVTPLFEEADLLMTVGRFVGGRLSVDLAQRIAPILNGQRALKREFLDLLPDLSPFGFGVEVFLSKYAKKVGARVKEVILQGVSQALKEEKDGYLSGFLQRYKMYKEGLAVWKNFILKKDSLP
jgi:glycosyltransferase involved in cell wall biosynthesis